MKKIFLPAMLIWLSHINLHAQTLSWYDLSNDKMIDLNKYKSILVKSIPSIDGVTETNYFIKNGRITSFFNVTEKVGKGPTQYAKYDKQGNLRYTEYTDTNKKVHRVENYNLVQSNKDSSYYVTILDSKNRVISRTSKQYDELKQYGWKTLYEYNDDGRISKVHKINYYLDKQHKKEKVELITKYSYDKYGNIIGIDRSESINQDFPINMVNSGKQYEHEKYEYLYDTNGNWTHRYFSHNENIDKVLLVERKFNK